MALNLIKNTGLNSTQEQGAKALQANMMTNYRNSGQPWSMLTPSAQASAANGYATTQNILNQPVAGTPGTPGTPGAPGTAPAGNQTNYAAGYNAGGSGGSMYQDTTAARNATQQGIDALDITSANSLRTITDNYNRIVQQYADEAATNKANYNREVGSNEQTREDTIQGALLAAAQGGRGLRATLGAMGAMNGTGALLASRAIANGANTDIGEGNKVFDKNATQLYNAYATTQQEEKNRLAEAEAAKANEEKATKAAIAKEKQSLYEKMAGLHADSGNTAEAARYLGLVGGLSSERAGYSGAAVAPYTPRSVIYNAGELGSYLAGANDMTVKTSGGNSSKPSINSPLYTTTRKREELE